MTPNASDKPLNTLKTKTVSGVKWQMISKVSQKVLSVATFAALARILDPSTFGLFAMSFVAIEGFQLFKSFGLDSALIHRKDRVEEAADTAFVMIQGSGFILFLVALAIAPFAALFFNRPEIRPLIQALGLVFIFTTFSKIPSTMLLKQMRFYVSSAIEILGAVINSVVAITLALVWKNVWALVVAYLVRQAVTTLLTWYFSGYRFKWRFDVQLMKELLGFGKFMVGLGILWYIGDNINNIIVGRILGPAALGYFALATNIGSFINTHFTQLVSFVMFPAYAALQGNPDAVRKAYFKTTKYISVLSIPFAVGLILISDELVFTLYGHRWDNVIPLIQAYGWLQLAVPILVCSGSLYLGCGRPKYSYYLQLYTLIIKSILSFFFTQRWGLQGTMFSVILTTFASAPVNVSLVRRIIPYSYKEFLLQFIPSLAGGFIMAVIIILIKPFMQDLGDHIHHAFKLLALSVIGLGCYMGTVFVIDRSLIPDVYHLVTGKLKK